MGKTKINKLMSKQLNSKKNYILINASTEIICFAIKWNEHLKKKDEIGHYCIHFFELRTKVDHWSILPGTQDVLDAYIGNHGILTSG